MPAHGDTARAPCAVSNVWPMMLEADADSEVTTVMMLSASQPVTQWLQIDRSPNDRPRRWGHPSRFLRSSLFCALPMSRRACGKTAVTELLASCRHLFFSFSCPFGVLFVFTTKSQEVAIHFSAINDVMIKANIYLQGRGEVLLSGGHSESYLNCPEEIVAL